MLGFNSFMNNSSKLPFKSSSSSPIYQPPASYQHDILARPHQLHPQQTQNKFHTTLLLFPTARTSHFLAGCLELPARIRQCRFSDLLCSCWNTTIWSRRAIRQSWFICKWDWAAPRLLCWKTRFWLVYHVRPRLWSRLLGYCTGRVRIPDGILYLERRFFDRIRPLLV